MKKKNYKKEGTDEKTSGIFEKMEPVNDEWKKKRLESCEIWKKERKEGK